MEGSVKASIHSGNVEMFTLRGFHYETIITYGVRKTWNNPPPFLAVRTVATTPVRLPSANT
jgi:hypothetical protein